MKKKILLALLLTTLFNLTAQTEKGSEIISLFGSYIKTNSVSGVTTNQSLSVVKSLELGASIGFFVADNVVAGVGLNYLNNNQLQQNKIFMDDLIHLEVMNISAGMFLPEAYVGYYHKLNNKLYLSYILKFSTGTANASSTSNLIEETANNPYSDLGFSPSAYTGTINAKSKYDYFSAGLIPELNYFVTSRFSLCLGFGGIEYSLTNWQKASANWMVSFHPNFWKAGVKISL